MTEFQSNRIHKAGDPTILSTLVKADKYIIDLHAQPLSTMKT